MADKTTVLVSGAFNVLHPGHLRLLRFAKECGDQLIVAVNSDRIAMGGAYVPEDLRLEVVQSNNWVDEAFLIDEPIAQVIARLQPNIVVKGKEHETKFNPELSVLEVYGGRLIFSSGETVFSSIDLLRSEFLQSNSGVIELPTDYMKRHSISIERLLSLINSFSRLKVCVIGDLLVDEYITCEALGMSQEEPTLVVTPLDTTRFLGGAGIVAAHAAGLGASALFISVAGNDMHSTFARGALDQAGVTSHLLIDDSRPTPHKQRYRSKGKSLLRVNHLHQRSISVALQAQLQKQFELIVPGIDLLVFSDFNYGCLPQALVHSLIGVANSQKVRLAADSQSSSQVGDISRFRGMDLITPTEREARISTRNHEEGIVVMAEQLRKQALANNILIKLGEEGVLVHAGETDPHFGLDDRISALNSAPKDSSGAGDSMLISSALTLASGGNIWEAACVGSLAAAIQVGRMGNIPLSAHELLQEIRPN